MNTDTANLATAFQLRPDVVFLNHGSFGACPRPVFETYQHWQRELEADPVDFMVRQLHPALAHARARLAEYVGTAEDALVFVPNATYGMNIVARSLQFAPGDEVLSTNHEYGAVDRMWRYLCERQGARLVHQPIPLPIASAEEVVEQLWAGVTPRTRVISISHITSPTALIFPIREICQRARDGGILTVVDGAHAPGQIDLKLDAIGADFYVGNCHKWLCAPKGAGFLYAPPAQQTMLEPLVIGWGWQPVAPGPSQFLDYFEYAGTNDFSAYLSVPAAIDFLCEHQWADRRAACHELLAETSHRIGALSGMPLISPDSSEWWGQMRSIPLPPETNPAVGKQLWEQFRIEVPIVLWENHLFVRVSIQAYNTRRDADALVAALQQLLAPLH